VLIITATNRFVTEPIAREFAVDHLIASEPETLPDGRLTGKLLGVPTYGIGKVVHLHEWLAHQQLVLNDFAQSFFYSDSQNDIPLLSIVSNPVATNPNALLSTHAEKQGWPTLHLFKQ
jgi:HAD superfamily phosphoserine phosphatase-like hydrolase